VSSGSENQRPIQTRRPRGVQEPTQGRQPSEARQPPKPLEWLLKHALPRGPVSEGLLGDLFEDYQEWRAKGRRPAADARYAFAALQLATRYLARRMVRRLAGSPPPGHNPGLEPRGPRRPAAGAGSVIQDVRFALRSLIRNPGFSAVAILTLGLGIGANVGIFSVVHGVLLRPLPYPDSQELVYMAHSAVDGSYEFNVHTPGNFFDWQARSRSFSAMAAFRYTRATVLADGRAPVQILGVESAGSLFDVLQVPPLRGRTFTTAEDGPGPEDVVVISEGLWQRSYGGGAVVGSALPLSDGTYTIVGIMPESFAFPSSSCATFLKK